MDCHPPGDPPVTMYTNGREVRLVIPTPESSKQTVLIAGESNIFGVDFDPVEKFVYWVDVDAKTIKRAVIPNLQNDPEKLGTQYPQDLQISGEFSPSLKVTRESIFLSIPQQGFSEAPSWFRLGTRGHSGLLTLQT